MDGICVVVESKNSSGFTVSCSGIRMDNDFIITHCCIVWTLVEKYLENKKIDLSVSNTITDIQLSLTSYIKNANLTYRVIATPLTLDSEDSKNVSFIDKNSVEYLDASLDNLLISPALLNSIFQLLSKDEWNFIGNENTTVSMKKKQKYSSKDKKEIKNATNNSLYLSTFLILKIKNGDLLSCLQNFEVRTSLPKKGDYIFLEGSPFGSNAPSLLLNSLSQGIIGNIVPDSNLFVTDARCTVGCEGGPAYSCSPRLLICGIILSPNCSLMGNWVGLTFVASIRPLLAYLRKCVIPTEDLCNADSLVHSKHGMDKVWSRTSIIGDSFITYNVVTLMELSVVRISVSDNKGYSWGSGVVVNAQEGIIISCAHVIKDALDKKVEVCFYDGAIQYGYVIYHSIIQYDKDCLQYSNDSSDAWDLAVIQLPKPCQYALPLAQELPLVGTTVLNGGHSLFWKDSLMSPTFSIGNLAKILELPSTHFNLRKSDDFTTQSKNSVRNKKMDRLERNNCNLFSCPVNYKNSVILKNSNKVKLSTKFICSEWKKYDDHSRSFPAMLQTTCAVYSGLSGGPVVAVHPVKGPVVIGIVTSCVHSKNIDVLFPHVNLAVPSYFISKAVESYLISKDPEDFRILSINSPEAVSHCTFKNNIFAKL